MNITKIGLLSAAFLVAFGASAQVKTVYIGMNGGTTEQAYVKYVFPEFEKNSMPKLWSCLALLQTSWQKFRQAKKSHLCT